MKKIRKLQGRVLDIERTGETITDEYGEKWEKCIFTVELTNFSKRTPNERIPEEIKGKKVKLVRYCCYDWHYKLHRDGLLVAYRLMPQIIIQTCPR